jgi:hypothetical protein
MRRYAKTFTAEQVKYLERRRRETLELVRRMPGMSAAEEAEIIAAAESDPDARPLSADELVRMRPMHEAQPEFLARWLRRKRRSPPVNVPKKKITLKAGSGCHRALQIRWARLADADQPCAAKGGREGALRSDRASF